jgi:hypothetical protein
MLNLAVLEITKHLSYTREFYSSLLVLIIGVVKTNFGESKTQVCIYISGLYTDLNANLHESIVYFLSLA